MPRNARACAYQVPRVNICTEPNEISLLFTLWYLASAGGLARINSTDGGAQERKVDGGTQQIPVKLAQQLKGTWQSRWLCFFSNSFSL